MNPQQDYPEDEYANEQLSAEQPKPLLQRLSIKNPLIIAGLMVVFAVAGLVYYFSQKQPEPTIDPLTTLPLGDNRFSTSPQQAYVFSCSKDLVNQTNAGYESRSWINQENRTWDKTKKITVDGSVSWPTATFDSGTDVVRTIQGNGLPTHNTGIFPTLESDDALIDRNTSEIKERAFKYNLPAQPVLLGVPVCVNEQVGVMNSGAALYSALNSQAKDAQARSIYDDCGGQPDKLGKYFYRGISSCIEDKSGEDQHSDMLGYSLDGFGIYGPKGENGVKLTSSELDVCHGHTHSLFWNGRMQELYHYHLTDDFPYSISCFRAQPAKAEKL